MGAAATTSRRLWISSTHRVGRSSSSSSSAAATARRTVSKEERARLRAERKTRAADALRRARKDQAPESTGAEIGGPAAAAAAAASPSVSAQNYRYLTYAGLVVPTALLGWAAYDPEDSPPAKALSFLGVTGYVRSIVDDFARPAHEKLLPDWSQMPNVPHDIPVPHTLVLDLESTLVSSSWDRKYGWRHAKRPGVDKFLHDMAQYYEIVLYTPNHEGVAGPVVDSLDKTGCVMHRLYRESTHYTPDGTHAKDLSRLNRDVRRIVAVDDDPRALQLQPDNLVRVKPYDDPHDRDDRTLERLTPLLIEIAREGCNDVPALLRQFRGMDADEIADEHERRVASFRDGRRRDARRGLGRLALGGGASSPPPPEFEPPARDDARGALPGGGAPAPITSKDLVGAAPPGTGRQKSAAGGGVMGWLSNRQKEQQEEQMRKMEKWNEVMMKKAMERKKAEEEVQKRMSA